MSLVKVSIAMATYNGGPFVEEQLRSFAAQTRPPDELVVCDDGSTDGTPELIENAAAAMPFQTRVVRNQSRLGYSANFEKAVSLCSGDVVFLSDQDDSWFPEKIDYVLRELQSAKAALVTVNDQIIADGELRPIGKTIFGNTRRLGYADDNLIAGCCTAIRREFLALILPFPSGIAYDTWLGQMAHFLGAVRLIERPLQLYRRHGGNTSTPVFADRSANVLTLIRRFGLKDPRAAWTEQIEILSTFERRILDTLPLAQGLVGQAKVDQALRTLRDRRQFFADRIELLSRDRVKRLRPIFQLWRRGFYANQFGWKSAIKDAIRS